MVRLTWFLLILAAIDFISYSDLVKRLFSLTDLFSDQYTLDFLSDTFSLKRASFLFIVFGAWIPFVTILPCFQTATNFPSSQRSSSLSLAGRCSSAMVTTFASRRSPVTSSLL